MKEYDFSKAKPAKDVPHLAKFHKENSGKTRITIMLDNVTLVRFREQAEQQGIGYQTLINLTLKNALDDSLVTEASLRKILHEELKEVLDEGRPYRT